MKQKNRKRFILSLALTLAMAIFALPTSSWGSCETEETILHNKYTGACGYTQNSSFTLEKDTYITRIRIWYDTYIGGDTLSATLSGPYGYTNSSGDINKEGCYGDWCAAMFNLNEVLKAGTYTLKADSKSVCSNPSGATTLILYGCDAEEQLPDDNTEGINPPNGISTVDANANLNNAPVYMGNIVNSGGVSTLSGNMELSVNFPAYNKPVDIWILIALPDGRFYTANESGKCLSYSSGSLAAITSGVSGTKTEKKILTPFEIGAANTSFEPWPADGAWSVYWLIAPDNNGDIYKAIDKGDYEFGFYSFEVKTEQTENADPGISIVPAIHITHSSGASADVPEREISYNDKVSLEQIFLQDDSRLWDWDNTGWQFVSTGGVTIKNEVVLKLPATGIENETILAHCHTGDWIKLDSQAIILDSGAPGLQVKIKDIPTPWTLVVATPPENQTVTAKTPQATIFEQLYWTDREQWKTEITNWIVDAINADDKKTTVRTTIDIEQLKKDLSSAYNFFNAAKLDQAVSGKAVTGIGLTPLELYLKGLDRLSKVRSDWVSFTRRPENEGKWKETYYYSDDKYMEQAIESALAYYVPWGIDFMRFILHTGMIGSFDMSIIGPYGEKLYSDVELKKYDENTVVSKDINNQKTNSSDKTSLYLRLYSTKAVATDWMDVLKDGTLQTFVRYLPTALGAAGLVSGGWTTPLIFAVADQILDIVQSNYADNNSNAYLGFELSMASASAGSFVTDIWRPLLRYPGSETSLSSGVLGVAQVIYSVALLYGVSKTDWFMLKDIKSLSSTTRGYCPDGDCTKSWLYPITNELADGYDQIPPIQLIALLQGQPKNHPAKAYPAIQTKILFWTMSAFSSLDKVDLHSFFIDNVIGKCEGSLYGMRDYVCQNNNTWNGNLSNIDFTAYKKENWYDSNIYTEPAAQSIKVSVPKSVLDKIASDYELSSSPKAEEYGLVLRVEAEDGNRAIFEIENFDEQSTRDGSKYFNVVIVGKWQKQDASLEGLDKKYDGHRENMLGEILQTKLKLTLITKNDNEENIPRAEGAIDFTAKDGKKLIVLNPNEINPYPVDAERVHVGSVDLKEEECSEKMDYSKLTKMETDTELYYIDTAGRKHGLYKSWYDKARTKPYQQILWCNGYLNGLGIEWYENGNKYFEGNYLNNKSNGLSTFWHVDGTKIVEGNYENDKQIGIWTYWHTNGAKSREGLYVQGLREGIWKSWHTNGVEEEYGLYVKGLKEGTWTSWLSDGKKHTENNYTEGVLNGISTSYYNDGITKEEQGVYTKGNRTGIWTFWDSDGSCSWMYDYDNSKSIDC